MEETVPKSTCQDTLGPRSYSCSTNASAHLTDEELRLREVTELPKAAQLCGGGKGDEPLSCASKDLFPPVFLNLSWGRTLEIFCLLVKFL